MSQQYPSQATQESLAKLRDHVNSPNFVYAVGYALEKVHSGVLANLLNGPNGPELVAAFWNLLCSRPGSASDLRPVVAKDIEQVVAVREHKTGSKAVVDLLVSFKNNQTGRKHHLVCEYKVEGTGEHEAQCERFYQNWTSKHPGEPTCFAFITTGGARYWTPPSASTCFRHVDLPDLKTLLSPYGHIPMVRDYMEALDDEICRGDIAPAIASLPSEEEPRLGYRGYSWWYAYYHALRCALGTSQEWDIYSGIHNPVMCWMPSWKWKDSESRNKCSIGMFYCEFNGSSLALKLRWAAGAGTEANFTLLRGALEECSADLTQYGFEVCLRGRKAKDYTVAAKMEIDITQPLELLVREIRAFVPAGFWDMAAKLISRLCNNIAPDSAGGGRGD